MEAGSGLLLMGLWLIAPKGDDDELGGFIVKG
jgi:hypothetical protein